MNGRFRGFFVLVDGFFPMGFGGLVALPCLFDIVVF